MKLTRSEIAFNFELGKLLNVYGVKPVAQTGYTRMLGIDLYCFGYRFRWYPLSGWFKATAI